MLFNGYSVTFCRKNSLSKSSCKPNSCNISSCCWIRIDTKIFGKKSNKLFCLRPLNVLMTLCSLCSVPVYKGTVCQLMNREISKQWFFIKKTIMAKPHPTDLKLQINHTLCLALAMWIVSNVLAVVRSFLQKIFTMNSRSNVHQSFHVFREMVQSWSGKCLE